MKLYSITDNYINYLRKFDKRVYDNKENNRKVTRKYLGIVIKVNEMNYYIPMSSPKKSDYKNDIIRKSIIPIIRIISNDEINNIPVLKGTLRISNMIPVPDNELILYEPKKEKDKNYKILVEKELEFIKKNKEMIKKYASIIYNQKNNNYNVSYIKNVVDFKLLEEKCKEYKSVAFYTLGCKVNQYETNAMAEAFMKKGYDVKDFAEKADIYVINTCTVTNMADRKSRQMLRRVKEINNSALIVATGCYAQIAKEKLLEIPEIDLVYGVNEKNKIVDYIEEYIENHISKSRVSDVMNQKEFLDFGTTTYTEKTRAVIKVQDGCDRFCTYCIIPYARGHIRSRKIESVVEEVKEIAKTGIKEIVITGIHVASYGREFEGNIGLIDLLEEIHKVDGIERIRLSSIEPLIITDEFITRLKKLNKICDHFHLSLQSGCDETLKRMNRRYTTEEFKKCTNMLKKAYPNVALTTDVIVGFPGETDEEFEKTYEFLKDIDFYMMHVFQYSKREGTAAAKMPKQVDNKIKEERSKKLIELSKSNQKRHNENYIGKDVEVLFEEKDGEYIKGHTTNYMVVKVPYETIENTIVKVKITGEENLELIGNI